VGLSQQVFQIGGKGYFAAAGHYQAIAPLSVTGGADQFQAVLPANGGDGFRSHFAGGAVDYHSD
jgi:hypothetical protein